MTHSIETVLLSVFLRIEESVMPKRKEHPEGPAGSMTRSKVRADDEVGQQMFDQIFMCAVRMVDEKQALKKMRDLYQKQINMDMEAKYSGCDNEDTLLMEAARCGLLNVVRTLLKWGAQVDTSRDFDNATALILAAKNGHTDVVRLLLSHGATLPSVDVMISSEESIFKVFKEHIEQRRAGICYSVGFFLPRDLHPIIVDYDGCPQLNKEPQKLGNQKCRRRRK